MPNRLTRPIWPLILKVLGFRENLAGEVPTGLKPRERLPRKGVGSEYIEKKVLWVSGGWRFGNDDLAKEDVR